MTEAAGQAGVYPAATIARLLNITERRLQQLAKEGIVPKAGRGQYPLAPCVRGYVKYLQNSGGGTDSHDPEKLPPFQRKAYYQSELDKIKLAETKRELIPRLEAEAEMAAMLKIVAECFDTLPDLLERDCGLAATVLVKVEQALDRAREDLHTRLAEDEDADGAVRESA